MRMFDGNEVDPLGFLYEPHTQHANKEKNAAALQEIEQFLNDIRAEAALVKERKREAHAHAAQLERSPRPKDQRELWDKIQELERRIEELENEPITAPNYPPPYQPYYPPYHPPSHPQPWSPWTTWCETQGQTSQVAPTARPWYGNTSNRGHE
jgi:hypothetical protein